MPKGDHLIIHQVLQIALLISERLPLSKQAHRHFNTMNYLYIILKPII